MDTYTQKLDAGNSIQVVESIAERPEHRLFDFSKRLIDIAISLPVVCFLLPPFMVLVAVLHLSVSRGPLFFRQARCGRAGAMFSILKFRTMTPASKSDTEVNGDPEARVFRFGHLLRFSKIDEVPQFVNVLRGEMSVVGPRPHHLQDSIRFGSRVVGYRQRNVVKPGITGLAQIREYAGEFRWNCTDSRVQADLEYISNRSLTADIGLILRTFSTVAWKCQQRVIRSIFVTSAARNTTTLPFSSTDASASSNGRTTDESSRKAA